MAHGVLVKPLYILPMAELVVMVVLILMEPHILLGTLLALFVILIMEQYLFIKTALAKALLLLLV
jgi:hypothetical protein